MYTFDIILMIVVFLVCIIGHCFCKGYCSRSPGIKTVRLPNGRIQAVYKQSSCLVQLWKWVLHILGLRVPTWELPNSWVQSFDADLPEAPSARRDSTPIEIPIDYSIPYCDFARCTNYGKLVVPKNKTVETLVTIDEPSSHETLFARCINYRTLVVPENKTVEKVVIDQPSSHQALFARCINYRTLVVPENKTVEKVVIDQPSSHQALFARCINYRTLVVPENKTVEKVVIDQPSSHQALFARCTKYKKVHEPSSHQALFAKCTRYKKYLVPESTMVDTVVMIHHPSSPSTAQGNPEIAVIRTIGVSK